MTIEHLFENCFHFNPRDKNRTRWQYIYMPLCNNADCQEAVERMSSLIVAPLARNFSSINLHSLPGDIGTFYASSYFLPE